MWRFCPFMWRSCGVQKPARHRKKSKKKFRASPFQSPKNPSKPYHLCFISAKKPRKSGRETPKWCGECGLYVPRNWKRHWGGVHSNVDPYEHDWAMTIPNAFYVNNNDVGGH